MSEGKSTLYLTTHDDVVVVVVEVREGQTALRVSCLCPRCLLIFTLIVELKRLVDLSLFGDQLISLNMP